MSLPGATAIMGLLIRLDAYRIKQNRQEKISTEKPAKSSIEKRYSGGRSLKAIQELPFTAPEKAFLNYLGSIQDFTTSFLEEKQRKLSTIAKATGFSISTIKRVTKSLAERGYIKKRTNSSRGLRVSSSYALAKRIFAEYEQVLIGKSVVGGQFVSAHSDSESSKQRQFVSAHGDPAQAHGELGFILPCINPPKTKLVESKSHRAVDNCEPAHPTKEKDKIVEVIEDCFRKRPAHGFTKGYCDYDAVNAGIKRCFPDRSIAQMIAFAEWLVGVACKAKGKPLNANRFDVFAKCWRDGIEPSRMPV